MTSTGNTGMIPGLAFGSPSMPASPYVNLPGFTWQQQSTSALMASPGTVIQQSQRPFYPDAQNVTLPVLATEPASSSQPQPQKPQHERDLSEGEFEEEFEDLYEPRDTAEDPSLGQVTRPQGNRETTLRQGSVGDADGSSIYDVTTPHQDPAEDRASKDSTGDDDWEPTLAPREPSGSYSPHLSPIEVHVQPTAVQAVAQIQIGE